MKDFHKILVQPETPVLEAMKRLDNGAAQIVLVVDANGKLLGTVTDGDTRRALLRGESLDVSVSRIMNCNPRSIGVGATREQAVSLMRESAIHQLPVVDEAGCVVELITLDEALRGAREETLVVIMAGGLGSRLRPLTETTPKPLLPIGGRPLLEITITNLARQGFSRFLLSVNYKADMFREFLADGKRLGVEVEYVEESQNLGTAGALRLLPVRPTAPILVMNGDILTNFDAQQLLSFHRAQNAAATMCVREYQWQIPYGVVQIENGRLASIHEKPTRREFVSAGINMLSPEALDLIPSTGPFDMPALMEAVSANGTAPTIYPLREYWLDIGHLEDLQRAQSDISALS
jgi:dTDP-glucose pyrophosphorylase/predicted transcriptional regulator